MQTFLPYPDYIKSAAVLDRQRLGKQRVETMQIMKALTTGQGWINHPATKMWQGHEYDLMAYQHACWFEWTQRRGYKDTCMLKTEALLQAADIRSHEKNPPPAWLGDEAFHRSHQSNLVRKDPAHYGPLFPGVPDDLEYIWPTP